jgi:hypothetical protein
MSCCTYVIAMIMGYENLLYFIRIKIIIPNVEKDFLKVTSYSASWIYKSEFHTTVDDINVTV